MSEAAPTPLARRRAARFGLDPVRELRERAAALPHGPPGAGPIHADLHHGNLLLDGESWTAIDVDDAVVGPFAFDLAVPLDYAVEALQAAAGADDARDDAALRDGVVARRAIVPFATLARHLG